MQRYITEALRQQGSREDCRAYLVRLRVKEEQSWQSMACRVFAETGFLVDASTLRRWVAAVMEE